LLFCVLKFILFKNPLAYFTNFVDLKLFKSMEFRNPNFSNRKEQEKENKVKKAQGAVSAQPGKRPMAHPRHLSPNRYATLPLALTCGARMSGSPLTSGQSPVHARRRSESSIALPLPETQPPLPSQAGYL
jgi:hypothetical protein